MATTELEYMRLPKYRRILHKFAVFFKSIPSGVVALIFAIGRFFRGFGTKTVSVFHDIVLTWKNGDYKTRISYFIFGFGSIARGQILRGVLFLLLEVVFIVYMILVGGGALYKLDTLGVVQTWTDEWGVEHVGDNSFQILLYGVMSIFFIIAIIYTWYVNIKQNKISQEILATGKPLKSGKEDLQSLVDDQFHKTLLALPLLGILIFTVLPIFFMILIAFTNYDGQHLAPKNLFTWIGGENFAAIFNFGGSKFASTFGEILVWTLIWAFFATFTNYFLGMIVAMIINRKGIKLKKLWRTILVVSIAIPQFISLLYVGKMFSDTGFINGVLMNAGLISEPLPFWKDPMWARITIILVNIWVGIPYLMLITSGILMNIPADLYESAKIDGASPWKMYIKITLPYMLFVTGPYLLSSFIGNMNNFNVIFLVNGGEPSDIALEGGAGHSDLLITWLYKLTVNQNNYKMASVIGIMVFVVVALISVVIYNIIPSMKNEEDFQ
ncbi:MAG: sugar ABC transporter permease [Erysipelotrichaceae bacterium]|jgi:arabinogalactan oligomer/maltooligosaccharide transport system permease protein|nr:sugar ABC transporter permease [Erysipelotrichaceae bacterium]